jgi:glycosyltransferase involved in cell wall biosynthesis
VVPSSYEPFGIVALEAGLAGVPLVVSRAGGLSDVIPNQEFGYPLEVVTGETIAQCITEIDQDPQESKVRAQKFFYRVVNVYNWASIANLTTDVYRVAMEVEGHE